MRFIGKLLVFAGTAAALWAAIAASGVLPRIPAAQREALERVRAPSPPLEGPNASIGVYLLSRGVEPAEWPRYLAMPPAQAVATLAAMEPRVPPGEAEAKAAFKACMPWQDGCLAAVRAQPEAARAIQALQAARLARIDALEQGFPSAGRAEQMTFSSAIPPFGNLQTPVLMDVALRFVDGDRPRALQRLCTHARYWRGLRTRTDRLIADMIGVAYLSTAANLYAQMLVDLPAGETPPPDCDAAFAPLADAELDQCRVMREEFTIVDHAIAHREELDFMHPGALRRALLRFGLRSEPTLAMLAGGSGDFCSDAHAERIARRAEMPPPASPPCAADAWVFNPGGCLLASNDGPPAYTDYYHRVLDLDGRLKLASTAAWLRTQPDGADAFERRPPTLRDARHSLTGEACAPRLHYDARKARTQDPPWEVPIAPAPGCQAPAAAPG